MPPRANQCCYQRIRTVAGPEGTRIVAEFESLKSHNQATVQQHHEQHPQVQTSFIKEVKSLVAVMEEMGNPFLQQSQDLLILDTRDILDPSVGESVRKAEELGEKQYCDFVNDRLVKRNVPITDVKPKNKLVLLSHSPLKSCGDKATLLRAVRQYPFLCTHAHLSLIIFLLIRSIASHLYSEYSSINFLRRLMTVFHQMYRMFKHCCCTNVLFLKKIYCLTLLFFIKVYP